MTLTQLAHEIAGSGAHKAAVYLLGNVPGLPPIVQTLHLVSIAAIMATAVTVDLRILGIVARGQDTVELIRRVLHWTWIALGLLAFSGAFFFLARPGRYLVNPVVAIKFGLLAPALLITAALQITARRHPELLASAGAKASAAVSLTLWIGVTLAGRWIAYADYLFPPE